MSAAGTGGSALATAATASAGGLTSVLASIPTYAGAGQVLLVTGGFAITAGGPLTFYNNFLGISAAKNAALSAASAATAAQKAATASQKEVISLKTKVGGLKTLLEPIPDKLENVVPVQNKICTHITNIENANQKIVRVLEENVITSIQTTFRESEKALKTKFEALDNKLDNQKTEILEKQAQFTENSNQLVETHKNGISQYEEATIKLKNLWTRVSENQEQHKALMDYSLLLGKTFERPNVAGYAVQVLNGTQVLLKAPTMAAKQAGYTEAALACESMATSLAETSQNKT